MITVFGSIGMDLLFRLPHLPAVGETVLTPAYTMAMGGKGANQAVAAARDGGKASIWPPSRSSMRRPASLRSTSTRKDAIRSRLPQAPIY
jgi:hypothetical protein